MAVINTGIRMFFNEFWSWNRMTEMNFLTSINAHQIQVSLDGKIIITTNRLSQQNLLLISAFLVK